MKDLLKFKCFLSGLCLLMTVTLTNAQSFEWAKGMGGSGPDQGYNTAADAMGNVYATGFFDGTAYFKADSSASSILTSTGGYDVFLAKYDAKGTLIWVKNMGGDKNDNAQGIAIDKMGNVILIGYFGVGSADFNPSGSGGSITSAGSNDIFLAKYDKDGNFLWAKSMGGSAADDGRSVAIDNRNNIYITGGFKSLAADFNPGGPGGAITKAGSTKNSNIFLAKYDQDGNFLWVNTMGGLGSNNGHGVVVDRNNQPYVVGAFKTTAEFDPKYSTSAGSLFSAGGFDIFLSKYDTSGNFVWARSMGGTGDDLGLGVAIDRNDNLLITGYFKSASIDFSSGGQGDTIQNVGGDHDLFLAKFDSDGNNLWAKSMGGNKIDRAMAVAVDNIGNSYMTGTIESPTVDFNPGGSNSNSVMTNGGRQNVFLVKHNPNGDYQWVKGFSGSGFDEGSGVNSDASGHIYLTGHFSSPTVDFNPGGLGGELITKGGYDAFVVKFGCSDTSSSYHKVSTCESSFVLNDSVYTENGIYTQTLPNARGCDSTITLDLNLTDLMPIISIDSFTLRLTESYLTYQWIKDGIALSGETGSTLTITSNGDYQVEVTDENDCSGTSDVYSVTNYTGVEDIEDLKNKIQIFPNPTLNTVNIHSPIKVNSILTDITGKIIQEIKNVNQISLKNLASGIYLLRLMDAHGILIKVTKVVKQE